LLHRQFEPLATSNAFVRWWLNHQLPIVNAWLAPLVRLGQEMLTRTTLDGRQLWVVPPALPASCTTDDQTCTRPEGRHLLDLPIGVIDYGGAGPAFAVEALYRLRHEHDSPAELVVMRNPVTPPDPAQWAALRQLVQRLRLENRVHLRPLSTTTEFQSFYNVVDALLLPDAQHARYLAVLSAMSSGCPLVCAHTPDAAELLCHGRTALLFPVHDLATCAQQLFVSLSSPAQADLLAARAVAFARFHYDPVQQSQHLETILDYVCLPEEC
jgi:hypothetical protein